MDFQYLEAKKSEEKKQAIWQLAKIGLFFFFTQEVPFNKMVVQLQNIKAQI